MHKTGLFRMYAAVVALAATVLATGAGSPAAAKTGSGTVYTMTNDASGNAVLAIDQDKDAALTLVSSTATGGLGTSAGLGNQSGLVLDHTGRYLYVVNAGDNTISVMDVKGDTPTLVETVSSGGVRPISLTLFRDVLYVLNAGSPGNITGFEVGKEGGLTPIPGSTRPLSGATTSPAQIGFSPDGGSLVVTEKATNTIVVYSVEDGLAGAPVVYPSSGTTPFGFAFSRDATLVVSEANGNAAGGGAASSYSVSGDSLALLSGSSPTGQNAACWVVISKNGDYAFVTNAASASISAYRIESDGTLTLVGVAAQTGAGTTPIDMALSHNGHTLYALLAGTREIVAYEIGKDGSLTEVSRTAGMPGTVNGLAAR